MKIIIIQNTFGYTSDVEKIAEVCKKENIILIEDLALSVGSIYKGNREAGTIGDFVALSFSQDKMIDGMSGGALIIRKSDYSISNIKFQNLTKKNQIKNRFYPFLTFLIRNTYQLQIGKMLHFLLKSTDLLSKPVENADSIDVHKLPVLYCKLINEEFALLKSNLSHRRKISKIYSEKLNGNIISQNISSQINRSSNLRFPIFIKDRIILVDYLRKYNIYVSDTWYDAPISPKRYLPSTSYKTGECPISEIISEQILNLPTHKNVSEKDAVLIAEKINIWLKSQ